VYARRIDRRRAHPEWDLQHDLEHFAELADHINSLMKQGQMLEAIGRSELGRATGSAS
jgi:hypothetical protein